MLKILSIEFKDHLKNMIPNKKLILLCSLKCLLSDITSNLNKTPFLILIFKWKESNFNLQLNKPKD